MLRCRDQVREKLSSAKATVQISERMKWETIGWKWCDFSLDGSLTRNDLFELIEDSYQLTIEKFDPEQRFQIDLVKRGLSQREVLTELIRFHRFAKKQQAIEGAARPALLLRTQPSGQPLKLGRSHIGGLPDLPDDMKWPMHRNGKSLAFLAQINLGEIAQKEWLSEFPTEGLLYFFSVLGWQQEGDADPDLPKDKDSTDWTRVLYAPNGKSRLKQTEPPGAVNTFPAVAVEFLPQLTIPTDPREPVFEAKWSGEAKDKYISLQDAFADASAHPLGHPPRHLLGGYADYEQEFVKAVAKEKLQLLFQLATDGNAEMCWGDGGYLYFWIKPEDLRQRKFEQIYVDYQCG